MSQASDENASPSLSPSSGGSGTCDANNKLEDFVCDVRNMAKITCRLVLEDHNEKLGQFAVAQVEIFANRLHERYYALHGWSKAPSPGSIEAPAAGGNGSE
jgi:hypothetical protein